MNILICGSRDWNNFATIKKYLEELKNTYELSNQTPNQSITIIHCGCKGADSIAGYLAEKLGFQVRIFKADWTKYWKAAGLKRNQQMLDEGKPNLVVAFHDALEDSKGTLNMVSRAKKVGIKVIVSNCN